MRLFKNLPIKKSVLFSFFLFLLSAGAALAAAKLEIGLPGMPSGPTNINPASYIRNLFIIGYSLIGFLAVAVIVWGGILYSIPGKTAKAKEMILGAVSGVVLLFCSYLILYLIDPSLTNLLPTKSLEKINIAAPPEAPSRPDYPIADVPGLKGSISTNVEYKNLYMETDLKGTAIGNTLKSLFNNFNDPAIIVTETTKNHGCTNLHPDDTCPKGGKCCANGCECVCNQSQHCTGRAVDIRTKDKSPDQVEAILQKLYNDRCVDDLFNSFVNSDGESYCVDNGISAPQIAACATHTDHIHFSISLSCSGSDF